MELTGEIDTFIILAKNFNSLPSVIGRSSQNRYIEDSGIADWYLQDVPNNSGIQILFNCMGNIYQVKPYTNF